MDSIKSIVSVNTENTRKLLGYFIEKTWTTFLMLKSKSVSIDKEKLIKTINEITVFLIMAIGVEKTIKLFWNILKIIVGCGYTLRFLVKNTNIENIENIKNIKNKVNVNEQTIGTVLLRLDKISTEVQNISTEVQNISDKLDTNSTNIDVLKKNVNCGVMGTDYYAPF